MAIAVRAALTTIHQHNVFADLSKSEASVAHFAVSNIYSEKVAAFRRCGSAKIHN